TLVRGYRTVIQAHAATCWGADAGTCWGADAAACWGADAGTCWGADAGTCWERRVRNVLGGTVPATAAEHPATTEASTLQRQREAPYSVSAEHRAAFSDQHAAPSVPLLHRRAIGDRAAWLHVHIERDRLITGCADFDLMWTGSQVQMLVWTIEVVGDA